MKKVLIFITLTIIILSAGAFAFYEFYFPKMVADAIVEDELPGYLPMAIRNRIEEAKAPVNEGAKQFISQMHKSDIRLEQVLEVIDNTSEEQAYALLDELKSTKIKSTNQVFDIAKKHIATDFDVEPFRKLFNEEANLNRIKKGIHYATLNRQTKDIDIQTGRAILKQLLLEKEKEYLEGK